MSKDNFEKNQSSENVSELFSDNTENEQKPPRRVTLTTFICTCIALVLAAVMLTYTLCNTAYQAKLAEARQVDELASELAVLERIFSQYSFEEFDEEQLKTAVLKAYVAATGDRYAEYYTNEEYASLVADIGGESQGIGINVINSEVEANGVTYKAFQVINVTQGSPADSAGLWFGDYIIAVGTLEDNATINALGYDKALKDLQGVKGTYAEFLAYRPSAQEIIPFSILRDKFEASSVIYKKAEGDVGDGIGVIKITEFDSTTPKQVKNAIEGLKAEGCDKFVFDVRYNPGGTLDSIVAVLSFFLDEGDTVISTKDKAGTEQITKVAPVDAKDGCPVAKEDIGLYKDLDMVVLCNSSTASAAELFTANFRDHELGATVGTKTFGKGSMQSYINLAYFGCNGFLKLTRHMYYPPSGESYDGIGIEPMYKVELDGQAAQFSIYEIMGTQKDNQLTEAVKYFKNS